jgi:hypothetical protein
MANQQEAITQSIFPKNVYCMPTRIYYLKTR